MALPAPNNMDLSDDTQQLFSYAPKPKRKYARASNKEGTQGSELVVQTGGSGPDPSSVSWLMGYHPTSRHEGLDCKTKGSKKKQ